MELEFDYSWLSNGTASCSQLPAPRVHALFCPELPLMVTAHCMPLSPKVLHLECVTGSHRIPGPIPAAPNSVSGLLARNLHFYFQMQLTAWPWTQTIRLGKTLTDSMLEGTLQLFLLCSVTSQTPGCSSTHVQDLFPQSYHQP